MPNLNALTPSCVPYILFQSCWLYMQDQKPDIDRKMSSTKVSNVLKCCVDMLNVSQSCGTRAHVFSVFCKIFMT